VSLRRSFDDDWMPKSFTQPQTTAAPSAVPLPLPPPPVALNLPLFGAQERATDLQGADSGNRTTARKKTKERNNMILNMTKQKIIRHVATHYTIILLI
jgi:hypothetical protein